MSDTLKLVIDQLIGSLIKNAPENIMITQMSLIEGLNA
jgi:hypothetical protein